MSAGWNIMQQKQLAKKFYESAGELPAIKSKEFAVDFQNNNMLFSFEAHSAS